MRRFSLVDNYRETVRFFPDDVIFFLKDNNKPHEIITNLIRDEMERKGIKPPEETNRDEDIINFLKNNNTITTAEARHEGFIRQSIELQNAVTRLRAAGHDIKVINDQKPFVYFLDIDEQDVRRQISQDRNWKYVPARQRVTYGR